MSITRRDLLLGSLSMGALSMLPSACAQTPVAAPAAGPRGMRIGMNLAGIADWENGYPFRNLAWGARAWLTRNAGGGGPFDSGRFADIKRGPQGLPTEVPVRAADGSLHEVFTILPNRLKPGRYLLLYDGDAEIGPAMGTRLVSQTKGRAVLEMRHAGPENYEGFSILRTDPADPIRNLRIVAEADERHDLKADPFRRELLDFIAPWHAIRFMDWTHTNHSLEKDWAKRKPADFYSMVGAGGDADRFWGDGPPPQDWMLSGGVAWEHVIHLANLTKIDPWICVPHRATDDYMVKLARLFKERLDPSLKLIVEYSNEVWNWSFQQAQWMIRDRQAGAAVEAAGGTAWEDAAKTKGSGHPERMGALCRRTFKNFESVFTGPDRSRLVRVIACQNGWFDTVKRTCDWVMANGGADALSTGGYFGPNDAVYARWEKAGADLNARQVIDDMDAIIESAEWRDWKKQETDLAKSYKLQFFIYEGGQHIQPKDQAELPYMPALKAAQSDPGMETIYRKSLDWHSACGVDLFCAFSSVGEQGARWGSWGHIERYGQPLSETPKMRAILKANPARAKR